MKRILNEKNIYLLQYLNTYNQLYGTATYMMNNRSNEQQISYLSLKNVLEYLVREDSSSLF